MVSKPSECSGCPLTDLTKFGFPSHNGGFSRPEGTGLNGVLILGEALGEHERAAGLPFRPEAPAGSLLEKAFRRLGHPRQEFRLWNIVGCQPPRNWLDGAPWEAGAISHCKVHLDRVIEGMRPRVILALGNIPLRALTGLAGQRLGISYLRGFVLDSKYGIPVVGSYHPSFLRRGAGKERDEETKGRTESGAGKGGMHLLGVFYHDILVALDVASRGYQRPKVDYVLQPSLEDARAFLRRLRDNPRLLLSYDLETDSSAFELEDEIEELGSHITQIQFSTGRGQGICFPWEGDFPAIAEQILSTVNPKVGHNAWNFDNRVLRGAGIEVRGRVDDTMEMWRRWQPDLPSHLQFVASMVGFPFPWKHLAETQGAFYGCADVDAPHWIMEYLPEKMKQRGVWRSYEQHVIRLEPILLGMSRRGINVDDKARVEFGEELRREQTAIAQEIQALVPEEARPIHAPGKTGYKKDPKDAVDGGETTGPGGVPAIWRQREFEELDGGMGVVKVKRWVKVLPFNPNSSQQVKNYITVRRRIEIEELISRGIPRTRAEALAKYKVPKDLREDKETTAKLEMKKLGQKTGDPFFTKLIIIKEISKLRGTYVEGYKPGPDGKVHSQFGHGTGTGQLTSKGPNVQNTPKIGHGGGASDRFKDWAHRFRRLIRASPGRKLVEIDFKSAHALTLGFEAQDPDYMRLARIDMHSFLAAAGILRLEDPERLLALSDAELKAKLKWYRKNWHDKTGVPFDDIRNVRAKPAILGYGFAMGAQTLYSNNPESYRSPSDAKQVILTLDRLFPRQPKFRDRIRKQAAIQTYLISRHGYIRWFFDVGQWDPAGGFRGGQDAEACIAFLPANDAFGLMKDKMRFLAGQDSEGRQVGEDLLEKYGLVNQIHDALVFDMPKGLIDEGVPLIKSVMEQPDKLLVDPVVAPGGLWIEASVMIGDPWSDMEEIDVATGWHYEEKAA